MVLLSEHTKYKPSKNIKAVSVLSTILDACFSRNDNFVVRLEDYILTVGLALHHSVIVVLKLDLLPVLVAQDIDFFWLREGP